MSDKPTYEKAQENLLEALKRHAQNEQSVILTESVDEMTTTDISVKTLSTALSFERTKIVGYGSLATSFHLANYFDSSHKTPINSLGQSCKNTKTN